VRRTVSWKASTPETSSGTAKKKENLCSPPEFLDFYRRQGDSANLDLTLLDINWGKTKKIIGSQTERCVSVEYLLSPVSVVSQKRLFCLITTSPELIKEFNLALNQAF